MFSFLYKKLLEYKKRLVCPHNTRSSEFRALKVFDAVAQGNLSYKDYSRLTDKDLSTAITCLDCGKQWYSV